MRKDVIELHSRKGSDYTVVNFYDNEAKIGTQYFKNGHRLRFATYVSLENTKDFWEEYQEKKHVGKFKSASALDEWLSEMREEPVREGVVFFFVKRGKRLYLEPSSRISPEQKDSPHEQKSTEREEDALAFLKQ